MSQPATETTAMPTTLTLITPTQDDTAQVVTEETTLTALEEAAEPPGSSRAVGRPRHERWAVRLMARRAVWAKAARCCGRSPMRACHRSS